MEPGQQFHSLESGSHWHRWEPHIHAPGTVLNDQFKGDNKWDDYLTALEAASPTIRALGITDYYSTDCYERVCEEKKNGRIPNCDLLFPNIEMRLAIGTVKGRWVNLHLLVSPEHPDHLAEAKRFLARLNFAAHGDSFYCNREDLIRLGYQFDSSISEASTALKRGSEQFKVSLDQLRKAYLESDWAQQNILVAVAGSETDGSSGVRDGADATLRQEIEKIAHIIFASSATQREFWLGMRSADEKELRQRYGGLKPCMHGSDAHEVRTVGVPDGEKYSWIKGAIAFDTLRQVCIDPALRAHVGSAPPTSATPSQVITAVEIKNAPWAHSPVLALNPGLVAIIGARGSGKTALADMIAHGCDATSDLRSASFLSRAHDLLHGHSVTVHWQQSEPCQRNLDGSDSSSAAEFPRARYLSQQFVEDLCSATGITDELMREVERVIFEAHLLADRDGSIGFAELLDLRATRFRDAREREEETLADLSERIGVELEKGKLVDSLKKQVGEKQKLILGYTNDRGKLVSKGSELRVTRLADLSAATEKVRGYLRTYATREQTLLSMKDEVNTHRVHGAPEALRKMSERHKASSLKPDEWAPFMMDYKGDVDTSIATFITSAQQSSKRWKGIPPTGTVDPNMAMIEDTAELDHQPLALLEAETARIEKLINVDRETANKFTALSKRIGDETTALERLKERSTDCEGATARVNALVLEREAAYVRVFDAIVAEEGILADLYSPLMERLSSAGETLKKLSFSVGREVNIEAWAAAGEELLDLRRNGPFKGRGTLGQRAEATLKGAWETGSPATISAAMTRFRAENQDAFLEHSPVPKSDQIHYREWAKRFAKWLYGTEHVKIHYSINYDGLDIRKLSPGTRGIVLLLLYLALDNTDDRPLIIDQPEENLDPQSIFDELVGLFLAAKRTRQVIMVTHNANLVVNTDADQVIVARAGPHRPGELPPITYLSGGLESTHIRKAVCDLLEGGERAFQERARRLRVRLER